LFIFRGLGCDFRVFDRIAELTETNQREFDLINRKTLAYDTNSFKHRVKGVKRELHAIHFTPCGDENIPAGYPLGRKKDKRGIACRRYAPF
jgi:hypothetical protein